MQREEKAEIDYLMIVVISLYLLGIIYKFIT
jgi:hypothetical protein